MSCPLAEIKIEGRLFPIQATNHTRELEGLAPLILDLGTRYRWMVNITPQSLYPLGKKVGILSE